MEMAGTFIWGSHDSALPEVPPVTVVAVSRSVTLEDVPAPEVEGERERQERDLVQGHGEQEVDVVGDVVDRAQH